MALLSESTIIAPSIRIYDPWFLLGAVAGRPSD